MIDTLEIGPSPSDENCVQIGADDYSFLASAECTRFIALIREVCGPEPEGAQLIIKHHRHDFGPR